MKFLKNYHASTLTIAATMFAASAFAGPPTFWPPNYPTVVKSKEEVMKCCLPKEKVALACKDCKTVTEKSGEDKSVLSWFAPDAKHDCSGCGGKVTLKQAGGGKVQIPEYTHTCTKCGDNSAYTCATHKMN